jgi:hypothetical protein
MNQAAPIVPLSVPLIFDLPIRKMITYQHFNDTPAADRFLYNQFHCPIVGGLFPFSYAERVCACCGTEVAHRESKEIPDYASGQPIAKQPRAKEALRCVVPCGSTGV